MKPWDTLTERGKLRRLRRLAHRALESYQTGPYKLTLVGLHTNCLFRVRMQGGRSALLRICKPGWRTETDLRSEAAWLNFLARQDEIRVPAPIPTRGGDWLVSAAVPGIPEERCCMLMEWIPGKPLNGKLNEQNLEKMGMLFADLHSLTLKFDPPEGFTTRKLDRVFSRGETDALAKPENLDRLPADTREVIHNTRTQVETTLADLYTDPDGLRVIHNDLWHGNIHSFRGRLYPLDFEDTVWGYPQQDIAMALQDLMMDVPAEMFDPLQDAFRRGYETWLPWPEAHPGQIDTLRAGRLLWVLNYVANFENRYLEQTAERISRLLAGYLQNGFLRLPAAD